MRRDGLPVYDPHPDGARFVALLSRGLSGRLLRLYAMEQRYLQARKGVVPEPAYLLLSNREGGFPGFGFCLAFPSRLRRRCTAQRPAMGVARARLAGRVMCAWALAAAPLTLMITPRF